ncbi:putative Cobalt ABC transporter, inner membrane subunit CbiQ [Magnetospirillum gryphiswaldense MSR-1 v2]|uniref:Cobalt ABC transporter, inner membrane subunit CbiQ n=1 Tax=Magnetospirillum gryphiswaldense (strain DSM 6361 / JCM 21280 / NBRC 15271 / MSR-1) TaxID=431944 RepID=V6F3N5_MAGGM|nr:cobalt ECF transporter T component CbiQ [Magnetospirillum gryphiswaldense]CDL00064.1 putative Cobalt ABC transporter, inner membrane subunit CbiQ [Magnetospirillum gryphiswaldense MSR-1 v2]
MSSIALTAAGSPLDPPAQARPLLARLDPRSRVLAALAFAVGVVCCQSVPALLFAGALAVGLAILARLAPATTLRRVLAVEGFMLLTLASLPFTMGGEPALTLLGFTAGWDGFHRAGIIMLKSSAVLLATLALLGTLDMPALGHALARLGLPLRFVALFLFTVRYIDVLYREYARLRLAMRARGFRPHASLHCWRSLGHLFGMLLVGSLERSERIHAAMRCRGFDGRFHLLDEHRPGRLDWGFGAVQTASLLLLAVLDVW